MANNRKRLGSNYSPPDGVNIALGPNFSQKNTALPSNKVSDPNGAAFAVDFTSVNSLDSRFTFSRSSTATFINSSGLVQYADANLILQSESLATSPWLVQNGASAANVSTTNPIGGSTATQLTSGGANNAVLQGPSVAANVPHTVRFWVRGGTSTQMQFGYFSGSFQTASGVTVVGSGSVTGTGLMTITGLSTTTWTQVTFVLASPAASGSFLFYPDTASPTVGRTNFVWGVQMNAGSTASAYNRTTTSAYHSPRFDYDPTTLTPRGLLIEGAATNLMTYSEDQGNNTTWNAFGSSVTRTTGQTDPGNNATASKLVFDATSADAVISRSVTVSNATQYTISMWMRADSGTVTNVRFARAAGSAGAIFPTLTTAWQRVSLTFTSSSTSDGIEIRVLNSGSPKTATVHLWGAQLELGVQASSYIPTGSSTVQRTKDEMTMANISALNFNPNGGTVFMQLEDNPRDLETYPYFASFEQSPSGRGWAFARFSNFASVGRRVFGIAFKADNSTLIASTGATRTAGQYKFATTLDASIARMVIVVNGGTAVVNTNTAATMATIGSLKFNNTTETSPTDFSSVWIAKLTYWPSVFPNATLVEMTK